MMTSTIYYQLASARHHELLAAARGHREARRVQRYAPRARRASRSSRVG